MHSFTRDGFTFDFNGDLSGPIVITDHDGGASVHISFEALKGFLAEVRRRALIVEIEQASDDEILHMEAHE